MFQNFNIIETQLFKTLKQCIVDSMLLKIQKLLYTSIDDIFEGEQ